MKTNWFIVLVALFAVCCSSDGSSSENPFAMGNEDGGEACKEKASDCSSSSDSVKHKDESSDSKELHGPGPVLDEPVVEDTTVVSTTDELPECSTANEGEAFAVGTEKSLYFCVNGTWVDDAIEKFGVTCSNGVLKLNAKAEPQAFDFDEAPSAYRRTQMNLVGRAEKGPFMYGSTVKVIELDSAMRLADSKRSFEACITSTDASYAFENLDLVSVNDKIVSVNLDVVLELSVYGIVLEHISKIISIEKVIDAYNLNVFAEVLDSCTENHTADAAKSVNTKFNHCVF